MNLEIVNVRVTRSKGIDDTVQFVINLPNPKSNGSKIITTYFQVKTPEKEGFNYITKVLGNDNKFSDMELNISKTT